MALSNQIWSIDTLSDTSASVEMDGGHIVPIPRWMLPQGVQEGDVYRVQHEVGATKSVVTIVVDAEEKARRLARSKAQVARKSGNDPGGDITL